MHESLTASLTRCHLILIIETPGLVRSATNTTHQTQLTLIVRHPRQLNESSQRRSIRVRVSSQNRESCSRSRYQVSLMALPLS